MLSSSLFIPKNLTPAMDPQILSRLTGSRQRGEPACSRYCSYTRDQNSSIVCGSGRILNWEVYGSSGVVPWCAVSKLCAGSIQNNQRWGIYTTAFGRCLMMLSLDGIFEPQLFTNHSRPYRTRSIEIIPYWTVRVSAAVTLRPHGSRELAHRSSVL